MDSRHIRMERDEHYRKIRDHEEIIERIQLSLLNLQELCSHENKRLVADDWWQCPDCDADGATDSESDNEAG